MNDAKRIKEQTEKVYGKDALKDVAVKNFIGTTVVQGWTDTDGFKDASSKIKEANNVMSGEGEILFDKSEPTNPNIDPNLTFEVIKYKAPTLKQLQHKVEDFIDTFDTGEALYIFGDWSRKRNEGINQKASEELDTDLKKPIYGNAVKLVGKAYEQKLDYENIQQEELNNKVLKMVSKGKKVDTNTVYNMGLKFKKKPKSNRGFGKA